MSIPTVEDRVEDIRHRGQLLAYVFKLHHRLLCENQIEAPLVHPDVYLALEEYAEGIVTATLAIDKAEDGGPNPPAPDVKGRAR